MSAHTWEKESSSKHKICCAKPCTTDDLYTYFWV